MKIKEIFIPTPGLTAHGGVRVLVDIANSLVDRGCEVTFLVPNRPAAMPFLLDQRVTVKKIGPLTANKLFAGIIFVLLLPFHLFRCNILANHFLTVFPAWFAKSVFKSEYVYLVQDIEYRFYNGMFSTLIKDLCEWTYRRGNVIAANSYLAFEVRKYHEILHTSRLGVAERFFSFPNVSKSKQYEIVYFLREERHKRIDRFDKLLPLLLKKGLRVLCISQNIKLLRMYSDRVTTICPSGDEDIIRALDQSKVLLLTSDQEGFGLPPIEAMSRGVPSVIFECGGPGAYAKHGQNCFIVKDGSEITALHFLDKLLKDSDLYANFSMQAFSTASDFKLVDSTKDIVDKLMEIYS